MRLAACVWKSRTTLRATAGSQILPVNHRLRGVFLRSMAIVSQLSTVDTNTVDVDVKVQFVKIGLIYDFSIGKNFHTLHCDDIDKSVRSQYKKSFGFPSRRMRLIYT